MTHLQMLASSARPLSEALILQNLFFGTLNMPAEQRSFREKKKTDEYGIRRADYWFKTITQFALELRGGASWRKSSLEICSLFACACPIDEMPERTQRVSRDIIDDESALVGAFGEGGQGLGLGGCGDDAAEFVVRGRAAYGHGILDLEAKNATRPGLVEFNNEVIHGIAMALLLHSNAGHHARLSGSAFSAQQMCEVIRDYGAFVGKARTAGQFSRCWFLV
jgi:hypothetical protein